MPAAWIGAIGGIAGLLGGSGGGTGGAGPNMYVPTGLGAADQGWQYNMGAIQSMLNQGWPQGYSGGGGGMGGGGGGWNMPATRGGVDNFGMPTSNASGGLWQQQPGSMMGQQPRQAFGQPSRATAQDYGQFGNPMNAVSGGQDIGTAQNPTSSSAAAAGGGGGGGYPSYPSQYGGGGLASITNPLLMQSLMQGLGINYNPYLQASQQAGQQYGGLAGLAGQAGNVMGQQAGMNFGQQQNLQNAGNALMYTAMDPQQALYNRTAQQVQDQSNATNSMYGLGQSGLGAGITGQNMSNFNIDWQNQQLQRMLQGAEGMGQLSRTGGQMGTLGAADLQSGMGYYGMQPGYTQQSAQVPLSAQQMVAGMPAQMAGQYSTGISQAMTPYLQQQNQAIPYMNYGSGAGANAFNNTLNQQMYQGQQIGNAAQALGGVNWGAIGQAFAPQANTGFGSGSAYGNQDLGQNF